MSRISSLIGSTLSNYSDSDIQKYNGKSVAISTLFEPLFRESNVLAVFKVSSLRASDDVKLRSFLVSKDIIVKRFKSKQLNLFKRVMQRASYHKEVFNDSNLDDFFRFMEGSVLVLEFEDINHFFFFEKFMLPKLLKFRFSFFALKLNNQYFFGSSLFLKKNLAIVRSSEHSLKYLKSFLFFQFLTVRNFLYFIISFKYQTTLVAIRYT